MLYIVHLLEQMTIIDFYTANILGASTLTIIPKFNGASTLDDFRLISVISVVPKLVSKLLADHLQKELSELVHPNRVHKRKGPNGNLFSGTGSNYIKAQKQKALCPFQGRLSQSF